MLFRSVPTEYTCPLTLCLLNEPLYWQGNRLAGSFEAKDIKQWVEAHHNHPVTREPIENITELQPDTELQQRKIRDAFGAGSFRKATATTPKDNTPIFIVGMPRSGSTLIEQILASHSQVEGTFELPDMARLIRSINEESIDRVHYPEILARFGPEQLEALGRAYIDSTRRHRTGAPFFTDKMPNNFPSKIGRAHV